MDNMKTTNSGRGGERTFGLIKQVRPTIVAAVGGTGVAAAKYTLKSMAELVGGMDKLQFLAVRAFDTAEQDNQQPRLKENTEFVQLSSFNVAAVLRAVNEKPEFSHWKEWLPPLLSVQQVASGVGGLRPKGRLCYCFRRDLVKEAINAALAQIEDAQQAAARTTEEGPIINVQDGIDIHIVSSVCGGTGSSMFIDLAYDIRNWALEYTAGDVTVIGHLVLPGAFAKRPVVETALMANAYAALQELDHFMRADKRSPWRMRYDQFETVESSAAPFDQCYLLDGIGAAGVVDVSDLASIIGDAIAHMTVSDIGQRLKFGIRNIHDQSMVRTDERDRPCCYSSYGIVTIEAKNDLIFRQVLDPLVREVIKRLMSSDIADQDIEDKMARLRGEFGLNAIQIAEGCEKPSIPSDNIVTQDDIDRADALRMLREAKKSRELEFDGEMRGKFAGGITRFDAIKTLVEEDLSNSLQLHGLRHSIAYLDRFHKLATERAVGASAVWKKEQESAAADNAPKSDDILDLIGRAASQIRQATLRNLLSEKIADLEEISAFARNLHQEWSAFGVALTAGDPSKDSDAEATMGSRGGRQAAAKAAHFQGRLNKEQKKQIADDVLAALAPEIADWRAGGIAGMRETIHQLTDRFWEAQEERKYDCETHFMDGSRDYAERLNVLWKSAAPMWEIDPGYSLAGERREISAMSTLQSSRLFETLNAAQPRLQPSSDQRQDLISIFRTEHGVSLMGLKRLSLYRDKFNRIAIHEQRWDFHLFNDRRWITEMIFPDERDADLKEYRLFSLATMLELVTKKEGIGYVWPDSANGKGKDFRSNGIVGLNRREAFSYFKTCDLFQRLEKQVDDEVVRLTKETRVTEETRGDKKAGGGPERQPPFDRDASIKLHIERLKNRVSTAVDEYQSNTLIVSERLLKAEIFQVHTEIRALRRLSMETGLVRLVL